METRAPSVFWEVVGACCCCCVPEQQPTSKHCDKGVFDWRDHPAMRQYDLAQHIADGGFSEIWLAKHKPTGQTYCLKVVYLKKPGLNGKDAKVLEGEFKFLSMMEHPNILRVKEAFESRLHLVMVIEYLEGGELLEHLHKVEHYSEAQAARLFAQVAGAVAYMHNLNILHRDIKPENVMFVRPVDDCQRRGKPLRLKLIDLGMAAVYDTRRPLYGCVGSPGFLDPAVVNGGPHAPSADVYGLGVLLFVMLTGRKPFALRDVRTFAYAERSILEAPGLQDSRFTSLSAAARGLVLSMLADEPAARITARRILAHPWITQQSAQGQHAMDDGVRRRIAQLALLRRFRGLSFALLASKQQGQGQADFMAQVVARRKSVHRDLVSRGKERRQEALRHLQGEGQPSGLAGHGPSTAGALHASAAAPQHRTSFSRQRPSVDSLGSQQPLLEQYNGLSCAAAGGTAPSHPSVHRSSASSDHEGSRRPLLHGVTLDSMKHGSPAPYAQAHGTPRRPGAAPNAAPLDAAQPRPSLTSKRSAEEATTTTSGRQAAAAANGERREPQRQQQQQKRPRHVHRGSELELAALDPLALISELPGLHRAHSAPGSYSADLLAAAAAAAGGATPEGKASAAGPGVGGGRGRPSRDDSSDGSRHALRWYEHLALGADDRALSASSWTLDLLQDEDLLAALTGINLAAARTSSSGLASLRLDPFSSEGTLHGGSALLGLLGGSIHGGGSVHGAGAARTLSPSASDLPAGALLAATSPATAAAADATRRRTLSSQYGSPAVQQALDAARAGSGLVGLMSAAPAQAQAALAAAVAASVRRRSLSRGLSIGQGQGQVQGTTPSPASTPQPPAHATLTAQEFAQQQQPSGGARYGEGLLPVPIWCQRTSASGRIVAASQQLYDALALGSPPQASTAAAAAAATAGARFSASGRASGRRLPFALAFETAAEVTLAELPADVSTGSGSMALTGSGLAPICSLDADAQGAALPVAAGAAPHHATLAEHAPAAAAFTARPLHAPFAAIGVLLHGPSLGRISEVTTGAEVPEAEAAEAQQATERSELSAQSGPGEPSVPLGPQLNTATAAATTKPPVPPPRPLLRMRSPFEDAAQPF